MEEELTNVFDTNTEIEDMPDFGEETETQEDSKAETEKKPTDGKKADSKTEAKKESKPRFKSNLPVGFSFNPLVIAIKPFYDGLIAEDEIFATIVKERESRAEKPKSLAECADYIMSEAYNYAKNNKQGNFGFAGFPDDEMYRLIRHYYDEEFLEVQKVTGATASVASTTPSATASATKGKEKPKPKPVKNVVDITKAIVSATKPEEDGKKTKREKKKDNLNAGFVPMERPDTEKEAKKGSREQAKSVEQMDLFADFFAN